LEAIISSTARCKDFSLGDSDELDETHRGYLPPILSCIEETNNNTVVGESPERKPGREKDGSKHN
jgi:hypothetical protein